ncbi:MAG: MerR family transcriptional regulator [Agathobacter sp.]|nr:MerR family transcriptional regulator [Agathobacter sp.]
MKIGEVANETGLSISNIRFYEKKGLLAPARKEESGYRDYTAEDVNRLKTILLYRKMGLPIETIYLVFQGSVSLEVALERQTQELIKQKDEIMSSLELCQKVLKETNLEKINVDTYLGFVAEEEEKGKHFVEIQEIVDDFTEYTGLGSFMSGNGRVARFINNPKVMRVISAVWLMTCILLPIFVMLESYTSVGYVSFQLIAFYVMWAFIMLVPFFKYHFVDKNRGDK